MTHRFQVHLSGIIDLLSHHLYSGPDAFVRELLQNGVDAIRARRRLQPGFEGRIRIECIEQGGSATLVFEDDGVGLVESEMHEFLATIGQSSKREDLNSARSDFLGQFGIGLLSCFIVSEEITVLTRSAKTPDAPVLEWRGRQDGTYSIRKVEAEMATGTQVFLRPREGMKEYFTTRRVEELAQRFGDLLSIPVVLLSRGQERRLNSQQPPWKRIFKSVEEQKRAYLDHGQRIFGMRFLDAFPLETEVGEIEGAVFIMESAARPGARGVCRAYLKDMLLSESVDDLMPEWAFFTRCIVNSHALRPTASRESFVEDELHEAAQEALGEQLKEYVLGLREKDPRLLETLIDTHDLAIKSMAVHDEEFLRIFADLLPFETTLGRMPLGRIREQGDGVVRWTATVNEFRQVSRVAMAQSIVVVNGGYVFDAELLTLLPHVIEEARSERLEPEELAQELADVSDEVASEAEGFMAEAAKTLRPFQVRPELRQFQPADIPALLTFDDQARFERTLENTREKVDEQWAGILGRISSKKKMEYRGVMTLNYLNPLVPRLIAGGTNSVVRIGVEMLYVQALLLGHHPLGSQEMVTLNNGMLDLLDMALDGGKE